MNGHRPIMYAQSRRVGETRTSVPQYLVPPITQDLRACVAATLLFFARLSSVLVPLLLYFSRRSTLLLRSAVSPFIEAVYRSVRLICLDLPCPSVCLTYFCFSEDSRLFVFRYSRSTLAGNASSCRASWCSSFMSQLVDAFSRRRISSFNKPKTAGGVYNRFCELGLRCTEGKMT